MSYSLKRSRRPMLWLLLAVGAFIVAACGAVDTSRSNWPGLSTDGSLVYAAYGPAVVAVDVVEQRQVWRFPTGEERSAAVFFAPPAVSNDNVILGDFGVPRGMFSPGVTVSIYDLQRVESGQPAINWVTEGVATDRIIASPLEVDDTVFVTTADNIVLALDVDSGQELWRFEMVHSAWSQPTFADGLLFVGSVDRSVYALAAETGAVVWQQTLTGAIAGSPKLDGDVLYVGSFDGALHALNRQDGEELWVADAADWVWSAPAVSADAIYFADASGNVYGLDKDGKQLWQQTIEGSVQASPVLVDDIVYVAMIVDGTTGALVALSAENGAILWQQNTSAPLFTTPVVVDDVIVVIQQLTGDALETEPLLNVYELVSGTPRWSFTAPQ